MNGFRFGKVFWKQSPETRHHAPVREIMTPSKKLESVAAE